VKTAISIPDDTFAKVTSTARALGLSRSEFMTRAAVAYLSELEVDSLKAEIDAAAKLVNTDEDTQVFVAAATRRLREQSDEW
jgi:Ribbon-helix-helix protein, copG family